MCPAVMPFMSSALALGSGLRGGDITKPAAVRQSGSEQRLPSTPRVEATEQVFSV
jgi:hypothetical protein